MTAVGPSEMTAVSRRAASGPMKGDAVPDQPLEGVRRAPVVVVGRLPDGGPIAALESLTDNIHVRWSGKDRTDARRGRRRADLDGVGIVGSRLIADADALLDCWGDADLTDFAQRWGDRAKQSVCAYCWDEATGRFAILPDPLGGAIVFRHDVGAMSVYSTDYAALIAILGELGLSVDKSLMYQVERTVFGNGGLWHASYEGSTRVPTFHHVMVDRDGQRMLPYDSRRVLTEPMSYYEAIARIRGDILDSVEAIATAPTSERLSHLTGGFDSRLVLGALLETGHAKKFDFFCSGPPEAVDRQVADGLARTFGLRRTQVAGLSPTVVGSPPEQQLALLRYTAGLSNVGPTGLESHRDTIAAGGGYGELFRSFYTHAITGSGTDPWSDGRGLATAMLGSSPDDGGVLTPEAFSEIGRRLTGALEDIASLPIPHDFVGDVYYSDIRNRYHMGSTTLYWSRVGMRVNPLYSVYALAGARELPGIARRANVLGFDILESFGHHLSQYPFDTNRSTIEYRRQRRPRTPLPFGDGALKWSSTLPPVSARPSAPPPDPVRRQVVAARAKAVSLIHWQSEHLEVTQSNLAKTLEMVDLTPYGEVVNVAYLRDLSATEQWTRQRVRHLYAADSMLMWFSEEGN